VLAESLHREATAEEALTRYALRRRPRAEWVRQESDAIARNFRRCPAERNAALRQHGEAMFQRRFAPLVAPP
jgi:2-polyprenyl-6-methoxyphenol hydroxylase-like FAD-dependent oxidoreductase